MIFQLNAQSGVPALFVSPDRSPGWIAWWGASGPGTYGGTLEEAIGAYVVLIVLSGRDGQVGEALTEILLKKFPRVEDRPWQGYMQRIGEYLLEHGAEIGFKLEVHDPVSV